MTQATTPQLTVLTLPISQIRRDGGTQPRARLNDEIINDYAEDMGHRKVFPPVVVFYDGQDYWLADGFHRLKAAEQAGYESMAVDLRHGTRREAVLHSVGANAIHGLRRTSADKRRAVVRLLSDSEWSKWSNVEIARQCAVSEGLIRNIKGELSSQFSRTDQDYSNEHFGVDRQTVQDAKQLLVEPSAERYAQRGGTVYTMKTANLGRRTATNQEEILSPTVETHHEVRPASSHSSEAVSPPLILQPLQQVQTLPRQEPPVSPLAIPGRRQRAKVQPKPEIIALKPKERSFVVKPRRVEVGSMWKLGKSHLLYCGSPDDAKFQKALPRKIELLLRVSSSSDSLTQAIPDGTVTALALMTPYGGDRDLRLFRELIQNAVDLYTDPGEAVVLVNLPEPSILLLMDELESHCFCAEPDPKRCEETLSFWSATGKQVERA